MIFNRISSEFFFQDGSTMVPKEKPLKKKKNNLLRKKTWKSLFVKNLQRWGKAICTLLSMVNVSFPSKILYCFAEFIDFQTLSKFSCCCQIFKEVYKMLSPAHIISQQEELVAKRITFQLSWRNWQWVRIIKVGIKIIISFVWGLKYTQRWGNLPPGIKLTNVVKSNPKYLFSLFSPLQLLLFGHLDWKDLEPYRESSDCR